ncbi:FHA domain-containing protein [Nocardioides cavernaquae]|uniref:FHA domain-containing protein n=2 Tax=Nocardioides cavernaquae TaxID=2321396 RepID=A0A3A5HE07_9ACTN|nr:FHA domain-containing protein [Nocardioides cavernaquae]
MDGRPEELLTVPMGAGALILEGDFSGGQAVLRDATVLGRGGECQLRCRADSVSRRHASVYPQDGAWWVRDLGSTNGTRLNGRHIAGGGPVRLSPGNRLALGSGVVLSVTRIARDGDQETQPMDGPR